MATSSMPPPAFRPPARKLKLTIHMIPAQTTANSLYKAAAPLKHQQFIHITTSDAPFSKVYEEIDQKFKTNYLQQSQYGSFQIHRLQDKDSSDIDLSYSLSDVFEPTEEPKIIRVVQAPIDRFSSIPVNSGLRPTGQLPLPLPQLQSLLAVQDSQAEVGYGLVIDPDRAVSSRERDHFPDGQRDEVDLGDNAAMDDKSPLVESSAQSQSAVEERSSVQSLSHPMVQTFPNHLRNPYSIESDFSVPPSPPRSKSSTAKPIPRINYARMFKNIPQDDQGEAQGEPRSEDPEMDASAGHDLLFGETPLPSVLVAPDLIESGSSAISKNKNLCSEDAQPAQPQKPIRKTVAGTCRAAVDAQSPEAGPCSPAQSETSHLTQRAVVSASIQSSSRKHVLMVKNHGERAGVMPNQTKVVASDCGNTTLNRESESSAPPFFSGSSNDDDSDSQYGDDNLGQEATVSAALPTNQSRGLSNVDSCKVNPQHLLHGQAIRDNPRQYWEQVRQRRLKAELRSRDAKAKKDHDEALSRYWFAKEKKAAAASSKTPPVIKSSTFDVTLASVRGKRGASSQASRIPNNPKKADVAGARDIEVSMPGDTPATKTKSEIAREQKKERDHKGEKSAHKAAEVGRARADEVARNSARFRLQQVSERTNRSSSPVERMGKQLEQPTTTPVVVIDAPTINSNAGHGTSVSRHAKDTPVQAAKRKEATSAESVSGTNAKKRKLQSRLSFQKPISQEGNPRTIQESQPAESPNTSTDHFASRCSKTLKTQTPQTIRTRDNQPPLSSGRGQSRQDPLCISSNSGSDSDALQSKKARVGQTKGVRKVLFAVASPQGNTSKQHPVETQTVNDDCILIGSENKAASRTEIAVSGEPIRTGLTVSSPQLNSASQDFKRSTLNDTRQVEPTPTLSNDVSSVSSVSSPSTSSSEESAADSLDDYYNHEAEKVGQECRARGDSEKDIRSRVRSAKDIIRAQDPVYQRQRQLNKSKRQPCTIGEAIERRRSAEARATQRALEVATKRIAKKAAKKNAKKVAKQGTRKIKQTASVKVRGSAIDWFSP